MAGINLAACSDDNTVENLGNLTPEESAFGKANDVFTAEEWYPGGQLGTTKNVSYSAPYSCRGDGHRYDRRLQYG